jgi:hypothetical protein
MMRASHVLLYRMCEDATEGLLYLMIIFSPWAFGSTQPWAIWTMTIAGYVLGTLLATKLWLRWRRGYPAARWSRSSGAHDSNRASQAAALSDTRAKSLSHGMGKGLLSPAQWLPKPATRWVPQVEKPLRGTWSSRGGEGESALPNGPSASGKWFSSHDRSRALRPSILYAGLAVLTAGILGYCLVSALNARATYQPDQDSFDYHKCIEWLPHSYDSGSTWLCFWTCLGLAGSFWALIDWLLGKSESEARAERRSADFKSAVLPARLRRLLWVLSVNGALLAVEGILQRLDGSGKLLWLVRPRINNTADLQFGPYAYRSNAAQYFNLLWPACLSFALTLQRHGGLKRGAYYLLLACAVLMAAVPILSISRGGALVCFAILLLGTTPLLLEQLFSKAHAAPPRSGGRHRIIPLVGFVCASLAIGGVVGWKQVVPRLANIKAGYGERAIFYQLARPMAKDYQVFGSGPGTFGTVFRFYAPKEDFPWTVQLHDDWLQTRITFGWVGSSLIALAFLMVVSRYFLPGAIGADWRFMSLFWLALAGCLVHARVDFPFQVHSILFLFLVLCGILAVLSGRAGARANG